MSILSREAIAIRLREERIEAEFVPGRPNWPMHRY